MVTSSGIKFTQECFPGPCRKYSTRCSTGVLAMVFFGPWLKLCSEYGRKYARAPAILVVIFLTPSFIDSWIFPTDNGILCIPWLLLRLLVQDGQVIIWTTPRRFVGTCHLHARHPSACIQTKAGCLGRERQGQHVHACSNIGRVDRPPHRRCHHALYGSCNELVLQGICSTFVVWTGCALRYGPTFCSYSHSYFHQVHYHPSSFWVRYQNIRYLRHFC